MTHDLAGPPPEDLFDLVDPELAGLGDDDIDCRLRHTLHSLGVDPGTPARRPRADGGDADERPGSARRWWDAADEFRAAPADRDDAVVARLIGLAPGPAGNGDDHRQLLDRANAAARQLIREAALEAHRIRTAAEADAEAIRLRAYQDAWHIRHTARPWQHRHGDAAAVTAPSPDH